jgi:DNA-binding response OmpR family regulator
VKILVVDDEKQLVQIIKRGLVAEGYTVDTAFDGEEGEYMAESVLYDAIILDIMLPKKDGVAVCRDLRRKGINTPILMLTAKDNIEDKVKGLDSGADDYLVKPFAFEELIARIRAVKRREASIKPNLMQVGNLVMDTVTRQVTKAGKEIELTAKEYSVLEYFMRRPNAVITRTMIEESVWDYAFDGISNVVDVVILRLRGKIDDEGEDSIIQTVRGFGYRLKG